MRYDNLAVSGALATESATVSFQASTGNVTEGNSTNAVVVYALLNSDGVASNNPAVSGTVAVITGGTGTQADVTFTGTYSFAGGLASPPPVNVAITGFQDNTPENPETVVFSLGTPSNATVGSPNTFTLTVSDIPETASVSFQSATGAATEGGTATATVRLGLTNDSGTTGLNTAVSGTLTVTGGTNGGALSDVSFTGTYTFGIGSLAGAVANVVITANQDNTFEQSETVVFGLGTPSNATVGTPNTFTLTISEAPETATVQFQAPATGTVAEGETAGAVLVYTLVNNDTNDANNPSVSGTVSRTSGTATGDDFTFNNGTAYAFSGLGGPNVASGATQTVQIVTVDDALNEGDETATFTLGSLSGATVGAQSTYGLTITDNDGPVTVTQALDNVAGYRLLSAPVSGVTVTTLAGINLVQGIPAGTPAETYPAQYPGGTQTVVPNLYTAYTATGYTRPADTDDVILPGRGFFWQFYDQNIPPSTDTGRFGSGTSQSYELPARLLEVTGAALSANESFSVTPVGNAQDGYFYMGGNPFATAMTADGVTSTAGTAIQTNLQLYLPTGRTTGGYQAVERLAANQLSTWQGFFIEFAGPAASTITYTAASRVAGNGTLVGRPATPPQTFALTLTGATADGTATTDAAALVRVTESATRGWDPDDATKLVPPTPVYALLAPVGEREGSPYRQAVLSLPSASGLVTLAFTATHAGTYTITAEALGLPEGTTAELRDTATGAVSSLTAGYTFTSAATEWTDRFVLALRTGGTTAGEGSTPAVTSLSSPRPNPATGRAGLTLRLAAPERVTATVVDALGRTVATLYDAEAAAGTDIALDVDASALAPGVYVVRVQGATFAETRRLTVVR